LNLLQLEFNSESFGEFWCSFSEAYSRHVKRTMEALIPFATIYLSEQEFSKLVTIETNQNRLHVQHDMQDVLIKTTSQFNLLI
jgi:hypothetical protein